MSEVKVNKISPRSGTTVTLGDSGDTLKAQSDTASSLDIVTSFIDTISS